MNTESEKVLWEAIYETRLRLEGLIGMLQCGNAAIARGQEGYRRGHIDALPEGVRRDAALVAFGRVALKIEARPCELIAIGRLEDEVKSDPRPSSS